MVKKGGCFFMKRAKNIYKRKDGRYEGRIPYCRDDNGKLKYHSVYANSYKEILQKMNLSFSDISYKTLKDLTLEWLCSMKFKIKESSYCRYETIVLKHIIPYFENTIYKDIDTVTVNNYIEYLFEYGKSNEIGGLSVKTVRDIITILRAVARYAESKYDFSNRLINISIPKLDKKITQVLNFTERSKLQKYLLNNLNYSNLGILISMYSGLRIGELCALTWGDIDLTNGFIYVSKTVQRINNNSEKGNKTKICIGEPKSSSSIREIPLPEFILEILRNYKRDKNCYILSGTQSLIEPRTLQYRFKNILNSCGIRDVNFHILRHTYATLCIEIGFDVKALSELLGHTNVNITLNRYVHSSTEIKKKYIESFKWSN